MAQNVEAGSLAITAASGTVLHRPVPTSPSGMSSADGKLRTVYSGEGMAAPSAVALSPDQAMLIVTDAQARYSWSFQIAPDGSLVNGEPFFRLEMPETGWMSGVHGAAEDSIGQVYFATPLGVQMCEANGRTALVLNSPEIGARDQPAVRRQGFELAVCHRGGAPVPASGQGDGHGFVGAGEAAEASIVRTRPLYC